MATYPEESFTSAFKAQAREKFPKAAIYAPLSTVEEIRTAAALSAVTISSENDNATQTTTTAATTA